MSMWLRQSTASQEILLGKFVDSTDAVTAETGLTIANTDIQVWKEGSTTLADKNSGGATHISGGLYYAVLDATDTDTLGKLEVNVAVSGALSVRREFMVLPAVVYDAMVLGTDNLDVNVAQWLGTAPATPTVAGVPEVDVTHVAGSAEDLATETKQNTAQADLDILTGADGALIATGAITAAAIATNAIDADALAADAVTEIQSGLATPTNITAGTITTVTNLTNAPTTGDFTATMKSSITTAVPTVGAIADQVWEEAIVDHSGTSGSTAEALNAAGSAGDPWTTSLPGSYTGSQAGKILADVLVDTGTTLQGELDGIQADTEDIQSRLPAALVSGKIDASVSNVTADGLTDIWTADSVTYGLTLTTMGRMVHNGGAAAFDGTVTGTPSSTAIELSTSPDAPSATDDFYNDMVAYVDSSTGAGQARPILDYNGTTKVITFDEALAVVPSAGDRIVIRASHVHPKTQAAVSVRQEMDSNSTQLAAIVADTNELQTDWANGGRLDVILDARASQTSVDDLPTNAELATALGTADDAVLAVLGTPVGADLSADIAAIKAGTLTAASKAKIDRSAAAILTGTVGVGSTTTTIVTSALSVAGTDVGQLNGRIVIFDDSTTTAALRGQATDITSITVAALPVLTVTALTTAPASTDTFTIT